jgi:hypothetical protein
LFGLLAASQPTVLFSHIISAPATSQPAVFFSHSKSAPVTSHQPAERGHTQHPNKNTSNVRLKKQMKHLKQTLATYMFSHCNICDIPIYFCNIYTKPLQHISEISTTTETYICNIEGRASCRSILAV